jgi:hypothetical protein
VAFNTFVDNRYTINLGGVGSGATLPPDSCILANNIVVASSSPIVTISDMPTNLTWQGNIFYGASLGISQPPGIKIADPALVFGTGTDSLWRMSGTSIAKDSAVGNYPFVTTDMDGQARSGHLDVGADEYNALSLIRRPLKRGDVGPQSGVTSVKPDLAAIPVQSSLMLLKNYPNPFNPATVISYELPVSGMVSLKVYDVQGKELETLVHQPMNAGRHEVRWNADGYASSLYFARLQSAGQVRIQKLVLLK